MPLLANNKIILRSISEKDLDGLFSLYANEEVMRFFGRMAAKNKQEVLKIIPELFIPAGDVVN